MAQAESKDSVTTLRETIRRASILGSMLRLVIIVIGVLAAAGWAMAPDAWFPALFAATSASVVALPLPEVIVPWLRGREFRRRLAGLPAEKRAQVLLPLHHDRSRDTRNLATALAHDFGLPMEITPAAAPEGRGDEPAGT